jgi:hypothetical protein
MAQDEATFGGALDGPTEELHIDCSSPYPAVAMANFLESLSHQDGKAIDWIVHVTGGSTQVIAESAVKRLRDVLREEPHSGETSLSLIDYVEAHVSLMRCFMAFNGTDKTPIYDDLLYSGIAIFFARALHASAIDAKSKDALPASELQRLYGLAASVLAQLNHIIMDKKPTIRIIEMLDSDILATITELWLLDKGNSDQHDCFRKAYTKTFAILQCYLHQADVLDSLITAFDQLSINYPKTIKLVPNLIDLRKAVLERAVVKCLFQRRESIAGDMIRKHKRDGELS